MSDLTKQVFPSKFHAFLIFPFRFSGHDNKNQSLTSVTLAKCYGDLKGDIWCGPLKSSVTNGLQYNEYLYFFPFVRKILYDEQDGRQIDSVSSCLQNHSPLPAKPVQFLRLNKFTSSGPDQRERNLKMRVINQITTSGNDSFNLEMDLRDAYLHLYDLGVGILALEVCNDFENNVCSLKDCLKFIDMGRRIYLPFISGDYVFNFENLGKQSKKNIPFDAVEYHNCPQRIEIFDGETKFHYEDFEQRIRNPEKENYISGIISKFLDIDSEHYHFGFKHHDDEPNSDENGYQILIDDRMFAHSFVEIDMDRERLKTRLEKMKSDTGISVNKILNQKFIKNLAKYFKDNPPATELEKFWAADIWYRMVYIDSGCKTCQNINMQKQLLDEATYKRWTELGTFYGYSRYSSMTLVTSNAPGFLYNQFQTMYYQLAMIPFFYRGALVNFSHRSAMISLELKSSSAKVKKLAEEKLGKLYDDFLVFRNRYWFREISAQEQGIEMFETGNKTMHNLELLSDIKEEIEGLYRYISFTNARRENDVLFKIALIGAFVLPFTAVASFWGMRLVYGSHISLLSFIKPVLLLPFTIPVIILIIVSIMYIFKQRDERYQAYLNRIENSIRDSIE